MVNIIIYLEKGQNAKELVKHLLSEKMIASASIDENNISYEIENSELMEKVFSVVTVLSKSLLFNDVVNAVTAKIGFEVPMNSIPIVASNKLFDTKIKTNTIPI